MQNIMFLSEIQYNSNEGTFTLFYRVPRTNKVNIAHSVKSGRYSINHELGRTLPNEKLISQVSRQQTEVVTEVVSLNRLVVIKNLVEATGRTVSKFNGIGVAAVA